MPDSGLGLEELPVADQMSGDSVAEPVLCRTLDSGGGAGRRNLCDNASAVRNVALAGVGATNQLLSGADPRLSHDVQCDAINVAVVAPRVSRRDRFDFVDPIMRETPRSIVSTRPSTSP